MRRSQGGRSQQLGLTSNLGDIAMPCLWKACHFLWHEPFVMSQRGTCVATNSPSFRCMTCWDSGEIERFVALNRSAIFHRPPGCLQSFKSCLDVGTLVKTAAQLDSSRSESNLYERSVWLGVCVCVWVYGPFVFAWACTCAKYSPLSSTWAINERLSTPEDTCEFRRINRTRRAMRCSRFLFTLPLFTYNFFLPLLNPRSRDTTFPPLSYINTLKRGISLCSLPLRDQIFFFFLLKLLCASSSAATCVPR